MHLHTVTIRFLHINRRILTLVMRRLTHWIYLAHLNHLSFVTCLLLLFRVTAATQQTLIFVILISLRPKVLIVLPVQNLFLVLFYGSIA